MTEEEIKLKATPTYTKVCQVCGVTFTTKVSWQKFHARVCRDIAHLRSKRKVSEKEYEEFVKWKQLNNSQPK
jgi:hypothetical protein